MKKRLAMAILLLLIVTPGATAWETETVYEWTGSEGPSGVTIDVHPITGTQVVAYGVQENASSSRIDIATRGDETQPMGVDTIKTLEDDHIAIIEVGGMSASMVGMAFCATTVNHDEPFGSSQEITHRLRMFTTMEGAARQWEETNITQDLVWATPCDTGLPRNGWQEPLAASLVWIGSLENDFELNQTGWVRLDSQGHTLAGPKTLGGEFQVGTDVFEHRLLPGWEYGPGMIIGKPESEEASSCGGGGIFRWAGCQFMNVADAVGEFMKDRFEFLNLSHPQYQMVDIVDLPAHAVAAGFAWEPQEAYHINAAVHAFEDIDSFPASNVAQRPGLDLAAGDVATMGPYDAMIVWHDRRADEVRFQQIGEGVAVEINRAFEHEGDVSRIRITSPDMHVSQGKHVVGAMFDGDDNITFFDTKDRGESWQTEVVTTSGSFTNETAADNHATVDVAYDNTREKVLVAWTDDTGVKVASKPYNLTLSALSGASRTTVQDFEDAVSQPEPGAGSAIHQLKSTLGQLIGLTTAGAGFFIFTMAYAAVAALAMAKIGDPDIAVIGALILVAAVSAAFGLVDKLMFIPMGVLFVGGLKTIRGETDLGGF